MPSVIPNLIEPSPIVIEQADRAATVYNNRAREPVKQVRRKTSITLSAQVSWGKSFRAGGFDGGQGGVNYSASGYLVFRSVDLEAAGVILRQGDKVVSVAGKEVDVYLTDQLYAGHHGGKPQLEFWDLSDHPLKEARP